MALLASLGAGLSVALASWVGQRMASQALLQHRLLFTDEAASSLRDLFVFVSSWPLSLGWQRWYCHESFWHARDAQGLRALTPNYRMP